MGEKKEKKKEKKDKEKKEKATVRSAPDGSDNQSIFQFNSVYNCSGNRIFMVFIIPLFRMAYDQ